MSCNKYDTMPLAKFNRNTFRRNWLELHHQYEIKAYRLFKNALDKQVKAIIADVKENGVFGLEYFVRYTMPKEPMQLAYQKCYEQIGVRHARFTFKWISEVANKGATKSDIFRSEIYNQWMIEYYQLYGAQMVRDVDQTTLDYIAIVLQQGRERNLTGTALADFIVAEIGDPKYTKVRAQRIARTESARASNYGSYLAGRDTDYVTVLEWISAHDSRTRPGHEEQDGKTIESGGLFQVNRYKGSKESGYILVGLDQMKYPCDPEAHVSQVVNCRCSSAYVPLLDEVGLPIMK